jgi:hypothetical protein
MFNLENFPGMAIYTWGICVNHVLQLVISDEILSKPQVKSLCDVVRSLNSLANQSIAFSSALRIAQQVNVVLFLTPHCLLCFLIPSLSRLLRTLVRSLCTWFRTSPLAGTRPLRCWSGLSNCVEPSSRFCPRKSGLRRPESHSERETGKPWRRSSVCCR